MSLFSSKIRWHLLAIIFFFNLLYFITDTDTEDSYSRASYACALTECRCACKRLGTGYRYIFPESARNSDCGHWSRPYRTTNTVSSRPCYSVSQISVISANFSGLEQQKRNITKSAIFFPLQLDRKKKKNVFLLNELAQGYRSVKVYFFSFLPDLLKR